jgi:hypothetical protein
MAELNPYPDMTSTYDSTAEAMRKVRKASAGGAAKKAAKKGAKKVAQSVAAGAAGEVAKKGLIRGALGSLGLPGLIVGTLAYPVMERLIYGNREQQMRDQMEIQQKIEMEQMGAQGAPVGGGAMGGYAAAEEPTMYEMQRGLKDSQDALQMGLLGNNVERNVLRNRRSAELEGLIAADADRISGIGSRRQLTPGELESILNG